MKQRVLTGITTTGTPHLGNYVGAIRPAVAASRRDDVESFYFLADLHALVKCDEPARVQRSRLLIAASWLAAGLDPNIVTLYRQSDVPETTELAWILGCVTAKGLMNRAHAYKAAVDRNNAVGEDVDAGISMGLFGYPVLMTADILLFNAHLVPVGRDQLQHLEMARDIAARFNRVFGSGDGPFVLPQGQTDEDADTLPGLDGRKMSKSYDNVIALFEGGPSQLRKSIRRIVTDSRVPGEPKDAEGSQLYAIYRAFADEAQTSAFRRALEEGLAWGKAKEQLFELVEAELAPMRERYDELIANPGEVEEILREGAARARDVAAPLMREVRRGVGLGT